MRKALSIFRGSEAFFIKTYVASKSAIHSTNAWYTATYLVTMLSTNAGKPDDAKRFSGILGCQNPGNLYISLHARSACQAIGTQLGAWQ